MNDGIVKDTLMCIGLGFVIGCAFTALDTHVDLGDLLDA